MTGQNTKPNILVCPSDRHRLSAPGSYGATSGEQQGSPRDRHTPESVTQFKPIGLPLSLTTYITGWSPRPNSPWQKSLWLRASPLPGAHRREYSRNLLICLLICRRFAPRSSIPSKILRSRRRSTFTTNC